MIYKYTRPVAEHVSITRTRRRLMVSYCRALQCNIVFETRQAWALVVAGGKGNKRGASAQPSIR